MTVETWLPIPGFPMYLVSSLGNVHSLYTDRNLKPRLSRGYRNVGLYLSGKIFPRRISNIVMGAFAGPKPAGQEVCHSNGDRGDDRAENLRYGTRKENHADKKKHGTQPLGTQVPWNKYSERQVRLVRCLISDGFYIRDAAFIAGMKPGTAYQINKGVSWGWLK